MLRLIVCALLVALVAAVPTQLTYTLKTNYVYNVSGVVQNNGFDTSTQDFVPGFYSYMQAFMVMVSLDQPIKEDNTSYTFVMNLFGTTVSVSNTTSGATPADPNGKSLGEDMYFVQQKSGVITEIQYYSDDPIYYVDVKMAAINAFQTAVVAVGVDKVVIESDPVGNHSAQVTGSAGGDGSLILTKVFSQVDFSAFPDPTVTAQNMFINAQAITGVHALGYIMNSTLSQAVILVNGAPPTSKRSVTNSTGFDMQLSALGALNVQYAPDATTSTLQSTVFEDPRTDSLVKTNMFDFAVISSAAAKTRAFSLNTEDAIATILSKDVVSLSALTKVGTHFKYNPQELASLAPIFEKGFLANPTFRDRLFFVLTVIQNEDYLLKYGLDSSDCDVVSRAVLAAAHFESSAAVTDALTRISSLASCPFAQGSAKSILESAADVKDSDFPFNKSYAAGVNLGGKVAAAQFNASVFAGTNFDCNTPNFNFETSAEGTATAYLFGYSQQAFDAKVIYGQVNGAALADALTLSVWGNVVYNQPIQSLPCEQGTYPLAHSSPGFSISHTLWVSMIPIIFSASASLDLSASWGWDLCSTQLSASIDVTGAGSIEISGSTYTDLLLLRAGFDLEGAFATTIIPQAFVHGTTCEIGFEIDALNQPLAASLTSYYQWETCKLIFWDCKWGKYNSQTWWSYDQPAKDLVLYKATFAIAH